MKKNNYIIAKITEEEQSALFNDLQKLLDDKKMKNKTPGQNRGKTRDLS